MSTEGNIVHGLRAAAKVTGWSPSGLQKMVDGGRVPAERDGRNYAFRLADLEAIRRSAASPEALALVATTASANTPIHPSPCASSVQSTGPRQEIVSAAQPEPTDTSTSGDQGAVASQVFADVAAGHTLTQIVVDRRLPPDVVRAAYDQWVALSNVDALRKPEAEARLGQVEIDIAALDGRLTDIEGTVHELSAQVTRGRQEVDVRLRTISARSNGVSVPGAIYQRLGALEAQVRNLPAAPLPIGHRCPGCGGILLVAASCSGCGAGRATS